MVHDGLAPDPPADVAAVHCLAALLGPVGDMVACVDPLACPMYRVQGGLDRIFAEARPSHEPARCRCRRMSGRLL